eukprot:UC1_evm1s1567
MIDAIDDNGELGELLDEEPEDVIGTGTAWGEEQLDMAEVKRLAREARKREREARRAARK